MRIAAIFGLTALWASSALATSITMAQVAEVSGKVLINHGKGFTQAVGNISLKSGDAVFIGDNSAVTIAYGDAKCSVTYTTPQTFNVPAKAPCSEGQMLSQNENLTVEPAGLRQFVHSHPSIGSSPFFTGGGVFAATALSALYVQTQNAASAP